MASDIKSDLGIVLESSLQSFFYDELQKVNQKLDGRLPNETIYYSSLVMDKFGDSRKYYDTEEGKMREKTLGVKLLESSHMTGEKRKKCLKDIGDTALLVCGFFSKSVEKKIIDIGYYHEVGQAAYSQLNHIVPSFYDVPLFYKTLSKSFEKITNLMSLVAVESQGKSDELLNQTYFITNKKIA